MLKKNADYCSIKQMQSLKINLLFYFYVFGCFLRFYVRVHFDTENHNLLNGDR